MLKENFGGFVEALSHNMEALLEVYCSNQSKFLAAIVETIPNPKMMLKFCCRGGLAGKISASEF